MTAVVAPAPRVTRPRPVPWAKLAWVTWRQHRMALAGVAVLLGGLGLYLLIMGLQIHNDYASVMAAVADEAVTVVLSSHALAELERVADYLIVLTRGQVQVAGEVEELLACHRTLTGPVAAADDMTERLAVVYARRAGTVAHLLVRNNWAAEPAPSGWEAHPVGLEELVLAYLREPGAAALPGPSARAIQDSGIPA